MKDIFCLEVSDLYYVTYILIESWFIDTKGRNDKHKRGTRELDRINISIFDTKHCSKYLGTVVYCFFVLLNIFNIYFFNMFG